MAGRGRAGLDVNKTVRPGDKASPVPAKASQTRRLNDLTFNEEFAKLVNGDLDAVVDKLSEVQKDVRKRAR